MRRRRRTGEESWLRPERLPTEEEEKSMFAMAVIAGVMGVMDNHCYRFNGQTRRQADGGSIGNQLTGEVADVVMAWWSGCRVLVRPNTLVLLSTLLLAFYLHQQVASLNMDL